MANNIKKIRTNIKEPVLSVELPLDKQFYENQDWENSEECYLMDSESYSLSEFESMDLNKLTYLLRHMANFVMERGISQQFIENFAKADAAYAVLEKEELAKENGE